MLPKDLRLTNSKTFFYLKKEGTFYKGKYFSVLFQKNPNLEKGKFGVVVSKKVSSISPKRNRIKRIVRALIFENLKDLKGTFVFYPKISILSTENSLLKQEIADFKNYFQGYNNADVK